MLEGGDCCELQVVAHGSYHSDEGIQLEKFSLEAGAPLKRNLDRAEIAKHAAHWFACARWENGGLMLLGKRCNPVRAFITC